MDEERRVSERLERIETLQRGTHSGATLLAELRGLLEDGEALFGAEAAGAYGTASAPERVTDRRDGRKEVAPRA